MSLLEIDSLIDESRENFVSALLYFDKALIIDCNINVSRLLCRLGFQSKIDLRKWGIEVELKLINGVGFRL